MMTDQTLEPVRQAVTVPLPPAEAFRLFTERMESWWPVESHSIGEDKVSGVVFEAHAGGRVYEVWPDGTQHDWAGVDVWEPPSRIVLSWQPNPDAPAATELVVRFAADGDGTRVEVEHRGWERLGAAAMSARASYAGGWTHVLGRYRDAAVA